jgi:hypothetical protein
VRSRFSKGITGSGGAERDRIKKAKKRRKIEAAAGACRAAPMSGRN